MMSKIFLTIAMCILGYPVRAQVKLSNREIKVLESTSQKWSPGAMPQGQSNGGGIIYTLKVVVLSKSPVTGDSMIIDNVRYPIEVIKGSERDYKGAYAYKDTLIIIGRKDYSAKPQKISSEIIKVITKNKYAGYLLYQTAMHGFFRQLV